MASCYVSTHVVKATLQVGRPCAPPKHVSNLPFICIRSLHTTFGPSHGEVRDVAIRWCSSGLPEYKTQWNKLQASGPCAPQKRVRSLPFICIRSLLTTFGTSQSAGRKQAGLCEYVAVGTCGIRLHVLFQLSSASNSILVCCPEHCNQASQQCFPKRETRRNKFLASGHAGWLKFPCTDFSIWWRMQNSNKDKHRLASSLVAL